MSTIATTKNTSWWPKLIIATFIGFGLFIGNMVRQAMQSDVDLVSKDYYQREIAYQQHMNQVQATQQLTNQVTLAQVNAAEQLSLVFPAEMAPANVKGQISFLRPSDAKLDFALPLQLNSDHQQHIRTAVLAKGLWRVQLNWQVNDQDYFVQQDITIE